MFLVPYKTRRLEATLDHPFKPFYILDYFQPVLSTMYPSPLSTSSHMGMAPSMNMLASPAHSTASRWSDGSNQRDNALPFNRSPSMSDFEIERTPKSPRNPKRALMQRGQSEYDSEHTLRTSISRLLSAKTRPYTVSGRIPLDPSALVLFFRSKVSTSTSPVK